MVCQWDGHKDIEIWHSGFGGIQRWSYFLHRGHPKSRMPNYPKSWSDGRQTRRQIDRFSTCRLNPSVVSVVGIEWKYFAIPPFNMYRVVENYYLTCLVVYIVVKVGGLWAPRILQRQLNHRIWKITYKTSRNLRMLCTVQCHYLGCFFKVWVGSGRTLADNIA